MHPELSYQMARLRHDELTSASRIARRTSGTPRRSWFRRRRDTPAVELSQPPALVLLPPPRDERDPARSGDQRVA